MMFDQALIFGILSMVSSTFAQVVDNQPAFVGWTGQDGLNQGCSATIIYANYDADVGTCYVVDQAGAYTAQIVSTDFATISFFSDGACQNDGASAIEANSETCTLAGYGSTEEYSIMLVSTDEGKRSLMEADIQKNGVRFDPEWENIRLAMKNGTYDNKVTRSHGRNTVRKPIHADEARSQEKRAPDVSVIAARKEPVAIQERSSPTTGIAASRVEIAPRAITTIYYMKCVGSINGFSKLRGCVNAGAHCDVNGAFVTGTFGPYGSCNAFCSCLSYLYHDEFKKERAIALDGSN